MTKIAETISIGKHRFRTDTNELTDERGAVVSLRPQSADVLAELARHAGTVVLKSDLMDRVWADTHVTDDSLVQCVSEIRKALGEDAGALVTVPKKGYRLDEVEHEATMVETPPTGPRKRAPLVAAIAAVLLALVVGSVFLFGDRGTEIVPGEEPVVAVLPFADESGDASQSYFADGLAEDLIVSLSKIGDLRVISRSTSFTAAQDATGPQEVAGLVGADAVLEGSVRRVGDALSLSASLVEGESGAVLWAERYEGDAGDIFEFQKSVLAELTSALSLRLSRAERARLGVFGTDSVEAHDAYLRGRQLENLYTAETNLAAEKALRDAIRLDPDFALAHAHLSQVLSFRVENRWTEAAQDTIRAAFEAAETALKLDPELPFAHFVLGRLHTRSFARDLGKAADHYEKAVALDPNYVDAYAFLANIKIFDGQAEAAVPLIDEAFRRNPFPPYWYYLARGMASYYLEDYETAEAALVTARDMNPTAPFPYRILIPTYGQIGDVDEAEWMAMEYEALGRVATIEKMLDSASIADPGYREKLADGLRKAGLPEN